MHTLTARKEMQPSAGKSTGRSHTGITPEGNIPNSVMMSMMDSGSPSASSVDELGVRIRSRQPNVRERAQAQIPQAENEADRLSASVSTGSPEAVKTAMGRKLGADFSDVRFHTGAEAAARANAMGARAYTSGADVYFGEGGFEPSVAAHELVHTVQQGMVDSTAPTMSTPAGGVQMLGNPFKWLWSKTGGKIIRSHHDALAELDEAMSGGDDSDWNQLTEDQKKAWKRKNPIAYRRYMSKKNDASFRTELDDRKKKRNDEKAAADSFLAAMKTGPNAPKTSMLGDPKTDAIAYEDPRVFKKMSTEDILDTGADAFDTGSSLMGDLNEMMPEDSKGAAVTGGIGGALGAITGLYNSGKNVRDLAQGIKDKDGGAIAENSIDLVGNLSGAGGGITDFLDAVGVNGADVPGNWFGLIGGAVKATQGGMKFREGAKKTKAAKEFKKNTGSRDTQAGDDLTMYDIAGQVGRRGTQDKWQGATQFISGAMEAGASIADLSGAAAAVGGGMKAAGKAAEAVGAIADRVQYKQAKKAVMKETTGITDDVIRDFMKEKGIRSFSRAKQALLRSIGYSTGKRKELFAHQTQKRGEFLADKAGTDARVKALAESLGSEDNGRFDGSELAKSMGLKETRSEIVSKQSSIRAMAEVNKAARERRRQAAPNP